MNLCKMLILLLVIPTQEGSAHSFLFIILINHPPSNSTFHSCCHSNYSSLCHSDYSSLCHSDYSTPFVIPTQEESAHSFLFTILINHPPSNSTFHSCCHSNYYSRCHSDAGGIYLFIITPLIPLCYSNYLSSLSFRLSPLIVIPTAGGICLFILFFIPMQEESKKCDLSY